MSYIESSYKTFALLICRTEVSILFRQWCCFDWWTAVL